MTELSMLEEKRKINASVCKNALVGQKNLEQDSNYLRFTIVRSSLRCKSKVPTRQQPHYSQSEPKTDGAFQEAKYAFGATMTRWLSDEIILIAISRFDFFVIWVLFFGFSLV